MIYKITYKITVKYGGNDFSTAEEALLFQTAIFCALDSLTILSFMVIFY